MSITITMDRAGRVMIPKTVRDSLHIAPGDSLDISSAGEEITMRPVRSLPTVTREFGILVNYTGVPLPENSILEAIELDRDARIDELIALSYAPSKLTPKLS